MGEDRIEMSQRERDRLKVLHEAGQGQITQKQAGEQLRMSERQVRRLLKRIREQGDGAVVHGLNCTRRVRHKVEGVIAVRWKNVSSKTARGLFWGCR
jgi:DNA-binding Lrp family transcriptional regulator